MRPFLFIILLAISLGVSSEEGSQIDEASTHHMLNMSLKELLMRDFGYDLKISGGYGKSRDDPIILADSNLVLASLTEMTVIRALGKGRQILWRSIAKNPINHDGMLLEQLKIETKEITDDEIITQRENYYFNIDKSKTDDGVLPPAIVYIDSESGVIIPYEIGWLHYDGTIDNEPKMPGLGKSIGYGAPGMKLTIYVYDKQRVDMPTDIENDVVKEEYQIAVSDLVGASPNAIPLYDISKTSEMFYQAFEADDNISIVALGVAGGNFLKLRLTYIKEPVLIELANDTLAGFHQVLTLNNRSEKHH